MSLDKEARLTLDFSAEDPDVIDKVNRLMKADEMAKVTIESGEEEQ